MTADRHARLTPDQQGAKAATKALIKAYGGQEAAAVETGKSQSRLCAYGLPNTEEFAPIDVIMTLEERTHGTPGHPHVTRWMAKRLGWGLVRLPCPSMPETVWSGMVAQLAKEGGELMSGICEDLASNNDVTPEEAQARLGDAADLVRIAVEFEAALKARAAERG